MRTLDSRSRRVENVDMYRLLVLCALLPSAGACKRKASDGAPCGAVAARMFNIATEDLGKATLEPAMRRAVADQLPAMRDSLTQICTDGTWSAASRDCMATAVDHQAFQACQQQLSDDQRGKLGQAARGGAGGMTSSH